MSDAVVIELRREAREPRVAPLRDGEQASAQPTDAVTPLAGGVVVRFPMEDR